MFIFLYLIVYPKLLINKSLVFLIEQIINHVYFNQGFALFDATN